jgi:hypothetical protein
LPIPLVFAAVLSQFSAAVADVVAGGGNVEESTQGRVDDQQAYVWICGVAVIRFRFNVDDSLFRFARFCFSTIFCVAWWQSALSKTVFRR